MKDFCKHEGKKVLLVEGKDDCHVILVVRSENNVSLSVRAGREEQGVMTRHSGAMSRKNNAAIHVRNQRE